MSAPLPILEHLLALLNRARGRNLYRGRQHVLYSKNQVVLEGPSLHGQPPSQHLVLQAGKSLDSTYYVSGGRKHTAAQAGSPEAWLSLALKQLRRGRPYIQTHDKHAYYKNAENAPAQHHSPTMQR